MKTQIPAGRAESISSVRRTPLFAYATGDTGGILANPCFASIYGLQAGQPEDGISFGSAKDLARSLTTALAPSASLSNRRTKGVRK